MKLSTLDTAITSTIPLFTFNSNRDKPGCKFVTLDPDCANIEDAPYAYAIKNAIRAAHMEDGKLRLPNDYIYSWCYASLLEVSEYKLGEDVQLEDILYNLSELWEEPIYTNVFTAWLDNFPGSLSWCDFAKDVRGGNLDTLETLTAGYRDARTQCAAQFWNALFTNLSEIETIDERMSEEVEP
jgi:hypothetical protein